MGRRVAFGGTCVHEAMHLARRQRPIGCREHGKDAITSRRLRLPPDDDARRRSGWRGISEPPGAECVTFPASSIEG